MKKFAALLFFSFAVCAYSQIDTIHSWERIPGVYYEDTNWWDHYCFDVPCTDTIHKYNAVYSVPMGSLRQETARHCYCDTSLKVIGIAAAVSFSAHENTVDTVLSHRPPEYFRLYQVDSTGMVFLREVEWHVTDTVRRMIGITYWKLYRFDTVLWQSVPYYDEDFKYLYEAYFDIPAIVKDTFYVSGTTYGDYKIADTTMYGVIRRYAFPSMAYWASKFGQYVEPKPQMFAPRPNYYKKRTLSTDTAQPDGAWQFVYSHGDEGNYYINIFPIIDTTYRGVVVDTDTCLSPQGLRVGRLVKDTVLLEWDNVAEQYELLLAGEGGTWDTVPCGASFVQFTGLDTAAWYEARVRSVCGNGDVSQWSDSLRFYVPGQTSGTGGDGGDGGDGGSGDGGETGIAGSVLDRYTCLVPNPTRDKVTVMSSYRIGKVVVYDLAGNKIMQAEPHELSVTIDLSPLPSGVYMVAIVTNRGTVHKRLIKE